MDTAYKRNKVNLLTKQHAKAEVEKEDNIAWEDGRDKRVEAWRNFSLKKDMKDKKHKTKFGRPEVREETNGRPMGMQT